MGCTVSEDKDEHPEYFKNYFAKVDSSNDQNKDSAIVIMNAAFKKFTRPGTIDWFGKYEREKDYNYYVKNNYVQAMVYADSMLLLTESKENVIKFAALRTKALFYKGDCYLNLKRFGDAFRYYSLAKQNAVDHIKDMCELVQYDSYNGYLFYTQGKFDLALRYFYSDYTQQLKCPPNDYNRFVVIQRNLDNIGLCYSNLGNFDSASYFFEATLDFIDNNHAVFPQKISFANEAKAVAYGNMAQMLTKMSKYSEAEKMYVKSIETTRSIDRPFASGVEVALADLYLKMNKLDKADSVLTTLKVILDSTPYENILLKWYKYKTDYFVKNKQQQIAFNYLTLYDKLKDSIDTRDKKFASMDINKEYEALEQKTLNEKLQKDNQEKKMYVIIALSLSILAVTILLFVFNNLRRSANHVKQLNRTNDDLQKAFTSLEQSHKENSQIMRVVAHDLKNPISAVRNLIYSLLKKTYSPEQKETLELMQATIDSSLVLISDLLHDKNRLYERKKEMVDMGKLLAYCAGQLQAKADEKNQHIELQTAPAVLLLHRQKIWRVISNLVNNAIKFSPQNSVINIRLERFFDKVLLTVKDNCIGIPAELKNKIFTLAPESSRLGTEGEESFGLGLSISRKIVEEHQGKLWFESEIGNGSIFFVELPYLN